MRKIRDKICQEALLWKDLRHPFILPFIGLYSCENGKNEGPLSVAMVCPWMQNGTIVKYLKDNQPAPVDQFLLEIAEGLHYLHSRGVIHGDLRGSNILVDDEGHARLADFGLASYANTTAESSARAGSTRWMAPELFSPDTFRRTWSTDVYAFACVCYELYHGKSPFSEIQADSAVLLAVIEGNRPRRLAAIPPST
ncbi:kinase-like domain-containing protein [Mycena vitilis]|nr:kinase-like domain-containing protein [Mycena vitilis]